MAVLIGPSGAQTEGLVVFIFCFMYRLRKPDFIPTFCSSFLFALVCLVGTFAISPSASGSFWLGCDLEREISKPATGSPLGSLGVLVNLYTNRFFQGTCNGRFPFEYNYGLIMTDPQTLFNPSHPL